MDKGNDSGVSVAGLHEAVPLGRCFHQRPTFLERRPTAPK